MDLAATIRALLLRENGDDRVERLIFGTGDPDLIAARFDHVCRERLGAPIAAGRFFRTSVGCVAGVDLADGRAVVVKAHPPSQTRAYLEAVHALRTALADGGFPCPRPHFVAEYDGALFTGEAWLEVGEWRDAHDPTVRRALAQGLAQLVARLRPFADQDVLRHPWHHRSGRWPRPHSPIFDFEATAAGAEWIDRIADRAAAVLADPAGERVVGHYDWRVEHVRFTGDRVTTAWDWDSTHTAPEPILVGSIAHAFCQDWSGRELRNMPSPDELVGFRVDYEQARGRPFTPAELRTCAAATVWAIAYQARCAHALSPEARPVAGDDDPRPLLAEVADPLLGGRLGGRRSP